MACAAGGTRNQTSTCHLRELLCSALHVMRVYWNQSLGDILKFYSFASIYTNRHYKLYVKCFVFLELQGIYTIYGEL